MHLLSLLGGTLGGIVLSAVYGATVSTKLKAFKAEIVAEVQKIKAAV